MKRGRFKNIEIILGTQTKEIRRLGVMMEIMGGHILMLFEGQQMLTVRLDNLQETVDSHTEMIGQLMIEMLLVKEDVAEMKIELHKKADKEDILFLNRRVATLEGSR